jgi:hypothetical protein
MDVSQRAALAMLSVRVGWLLLKLRRVEQACALFDAAHRTLLRVVGASTPAGYLAAPGAIYAIYAICD